MASQKPITESLVEVGDSVLAVIDIQDHFLNKYDAATSRSLVARVVWLLQVARHLDVPVVAMAEDMDRAGPLATAVQEALPAGTQVHDKDFFGLAGNPDILAAVEATGRCTVVLVGVETDVCVAQSALGLVGAGYRVAALHDAVATTASDQETGLERMRGAGVAILSVKSLYYEWLRSVSRTRALRNAMQELERLRPVDLIL